METPEISHAMKKVGWHQFFVSLIAVPMGILVARMIAKAVTFATAGDVKNTVVTAVTLTIAVIVWRAVTAFAQAALAKEKSRVLQGYRMSIYQKLLQLPLYRLYQNERGQSMEGLTDDLNKAATRDTELKPNLLISIITVVAYGAFIACYSPATAGILLLLSLLQLIPPLVVKKYMQVNYDDCREIEAKLDGFLLEAYHGFSTIKLYGQNNRMLQKLKALHKDYIKIGNRSTITVHAEDSMETLLQNILQYGTYGLVGFLVLVNFTTMEAGIGAIALSASFYAAVLSAFQTIPEFGTVKVAEKRLSAWLTPDADAAHSELPTGENAIIFDDVNYRYSEESVTLSDFSEKIGAGVTLIRGANGSGKSTLLKLATGLLPMQSGTLTVKGVAPEGISPQSFPSNILLLPQDDLKIAITPMELFEMVEGLSQERAAECALSFGLTKELLTEKRINQLSTGQRKKVYLAMAFTLGSSVLLLDEPNNGLDVQGEERLISLLNDRKNANAGKNSPITVVVTHDPALDAAADRVIALAEREVANS